MLLARRPLHLFKLGFFVNSFIPGENIKHRLSESNKAEGLFLFFFYRCSENVDMPVPFFMTLSGILCFLFMFDCKAFFTAYFIDSTLSAMNIETLLLPSFLMFNSYVLAFV